MFSRELNNANSDVETIIDEYDDFVFLNGNTCADALGIACLVVAAVWFTIWYNKQERNQQ